MTTNPDIEVRLRWVTQALVLLFGAFLLLGMVLHLVSPESALSSGLLEAGIVLLMAAPAVRVLIAVAERVRRSDWPFVVMTLVVVIELAIVLWRAAGKV